MGGEPWVGSRGWGASTRGTHLGDGGPLLVGDVDEGAAEADAADHLEQLMAARLGVLVVCPERADERGGWHLLLRALDDDLQRLKEVGAQRLLVGLVELKVLVTLELERPLALQPWVGAQPLERRLVGEGEPLQVLNRRARVQTLLGLIGRDALAEAHHHARLHRTDVQDIAAARPAGVAELLR
jgi:hypothetical protein